MKRVLNTETGELVEAPTSYITQPTPGPFFKTPFNHDRDKESDSSGLACRDPSKTQQQFLADADINNILKKFLDTRDPTTIPQIAGAPVYRDIEEEFDLQDQMVTAWDVEQAWNKLPVQARAILQTPERFVAWYDKCLEEGNVQGLRDIGLIPPEDPPTAPSGDPKASGGDTPAPQTPKPDAAPAAAGNVTSS